MEGNAGKQEAENSSVYTEEVIQHNFISAIDIASIVGFWLRLGLHRTILGDKQST